DLFVDGRAPVDTEARRARTATPSFRPLFDPALPERTLARSRQKLPGGRRSDWEPQLELELGLARPHDRPPSRELRLEAGLEVHHPAGDLAHILVVLRMRTKAERNRVEPELRRRGSRQKRVALLLDLVLEQPVGDDHRRARELLARSDRPADEVA